MNKIAWHRWGVLFLLFVLVSIPLIEALAYEEQAALQALPAPWKIDTVDDGRLIGNLGPHSLAYGGPNNYPHTAYGKDRLYHSYWDGAAWVTETIDSSVMVGKNASIAVDSLGWVYITYYDETNADLKFATNWKGWWEITTLASSGDVGSQSYVFASWAEQGPDVSVGYLDSTNHNVKFLYSDVDMNGYWSAPELVSGSLYVTSFAMTMRAYTPYVSLAYLNTGTSQFNIGYTTYDEFGNWTTPEVVSDEQCSATTGIAVDGAGVPYIPVSYNVNGLGWITYLAYREGDLWVGAMNSNLLLSLYDPKPDALSISYSPVEELVYIAMQLPTSNPSYHDLFVVRGLKDIWDSGTSYYVQNDAYGDNFPAVAVPANTDSLKAGVIYLSASFLKYEYLNGAPESWKEDRSPVDASSDRGACNVVRVDNSGRVHLLYYRADTGALNYRVTNASGWSSTFTVSGSGEWADCSWISRPSMDLRSDGTPVVSYVNSNDELVYAAWSCGGRCGFTRNTVDTGLSNGSTAIAVSTADKINILYHKNDHLTFAYNTIPQLLAWNTLVVDSSISTYGPISLETDGNDRLHAAFVSIMDYPYYGRYGFGSNTWTGIVQLEDSSWTMDPVRVAVNPLNNLPQVAYILGKDLKISSYNCNLIFCVWSPSIVDTPTDPMGALGAPSFTIDSKGRRLLAYYYSSPAQGQKGLKYLTLDGATSRSQMIESTTNTIDGTSMALRSGDVPVISYHLWQFGQVKVAWGSYGIFLPVIVR